MEKGEKYKAEMISAIKKHNWMRWSHIDWNALSFSRATAYLYKLNELDAIKSQFSDNSSKGVNYLLQKWMTSGNATLEIAAMRLIAEEEDRQRLNQQYIDHTTAGEKIAVNFIDGSKG